jgi:hypothetical protein
MIEAVGECPCTEYNEFMELSEMRDQLADFETRTDKLGRRL